MKCLRVEVLQEQAKQQEEQLEQQEQLEQEQLVRQEQITGLQADSLRGRELLTVKADTVRDTDTVKADTAEEEQPEQLPDVLPEKLHADIGRKALTVKDRAQASGRAQDLEEEQ